MRHFLAILFLGLCANMVFAKGGSGTYYIKGTAYTTNKTILKNVSLKVKIGRVTKTVQTDENGQYEIDVNWESACPSGRTITQHKRDNKKLNPEYIYISYGDREIKLDNDWLKYGDLFPESKDKVTRKKDLHFT